MHCGPPNQNFGWAMAHPAHAAAPPMPLVSSAVEKPHDILRHIVAFNAADDLPNF